MEIHIEKQISQEKYSEIIHLAFTDYNNAMQTLDDMKPLLVKAYDGYDIVEARKRFDGILQGILLITALSDGGLTHIEQNFISSITDNCDLLEEISNSNTDEYYTWSGIEKLSDEELRHLISLVHKEISAYIDDFVKPLAFIDALTDRNFEDELTTAITGMCLALISADGKVVSNELSNTRKAIDSFFLDKYLKYKEEYTASLS